MIQFLRKSFLTGGLCLAVLGAPGVARADETPAPADAKTPAATANPPAAPVTITAKVIVVNRAERTVTFEVEGKLYLLKVGPNTTIARKNKVVTLDHLAAGQIVSMVVGETADGKVELVAVNIDPSLRKAEAAGRPQPVPGAARLPEPFPGSRNPANFAGPLISPNN